MSRSAAVARQSRISYRGGQIDPPPSKIGLTLISPGGGGGGGGGGALNIFRDKSTARIGLAGGFMSFFLIVSRIFWEQTCDVRVYGYKVT